MKELFKPILGIKTRYVVHGEGEPAVLLHGLGGSVASWRANIEPLSKLCKVYAIDLPGHGASEKPDIDYNLAFAVRFLNAFWVEERLGRAWLMGNSTGGLIALEYAYQFPERVAGLVLVGSVGFGQELALFLRLMSVPLLGEVMSVPSRRNVRALLKIIFYDPDAIPPDIIEEMYGYRKSPGAKKAVLKALRSGVSLAGLHKSLLMHEKAKALHLPTLIAWGENDRIAPAAQAHRAQQAIEGAQLHIFPSCGHWPQMERAEEFNPLVAGFVEEVSRPARREASGSPGVQP